jgi:hypothetical protein
MKEYLRYYENDYEKIFNYLVRLKRGFASTDKEGCFLKDVVYLNGFLEVSKYIE